jgi:hypothetical protein
MSNSSMARRPAPIFSLRALGAVLTVALAACAGCSPKKQSEAKTDTASAAEIPPRIWEQFSGENAFREVQRQVDLGPRPSGSAALAHARTLIAESLKRSGWEIERQEFDHTPVPAQGSLHFTNLIARFSRNEKRPALRNTQRVIIGSHYDTKRMDGIRFVGANDGASSTGALLELARVLAKAPDLASRVELVFFDGEEAVVQFGPAETGPDGLVGSRHYAQVLRESGRAAQFRFAIVWDMIGDADLTVTLPRDTPPALASGLFAGAEALGVRRNFGYSSGDIMDDHTPLHIIARITAMDIIDFDYPPWHTSADTMDKLNAASLQTIGRVTTWLLARELAK